jgi:hypothetical protein
VLRYPEGSCGIYRGVEISPSYNIPRPHFVLSTSVSESYQQYDDLQRYLDNQKNSKNVLIGTFFSQAAAFWIDWLV